MKLDELFERLRPVGASREDFQAGSKFETLLSNLESKLEKAMQFSMEKDEDLYPIFEEQRQALQEVAKNLANLRKNKDEDSVTALKESLATEAKTSKIARKIISDRPDEDKLKFDSNLEASMIIKSSQEQLHQLMSEIDSFREITKENKDSVVELSKTFKEITSDLNKDNKLGAAATAIAPITKKFDVGDKSERIEESISVIDESDDKDLDLGSGKNSKSELQSIRELLEKKLYETKIQESNLLLENLNLTKKEERNEEDSEERVSDNIIIKKLDEFSDELDALDMRDGEFQSVEGEVDNTKTSTEVDLKEPDFEIKEAESDRNGDSIERANADSETYLSELSEDQTYKQDIASIREDVSKILALMGEGASYEESDSEEDLNELKSGSSGSAFSLGSMLGFGKLTKAITGFGALLSKAGLVAGAAAITWKVVDGIMTPMLEESRKKEAASRDVVSDRNKVIENEVAELSDEDKAKYEELKNKFYEETYKEANPSETTKWEYEEGLVKKDPKEDYKRIDRAEWVRRIADREEKLKYRALNLVRFGTETPTQEQIAEYRKERGGSTDLGLSEVEMANVNAYLENPTVDANKKLTRREKEAVVTLKLRNARENKVESDNMLLSERDKILDSYRNDGKELNEETYNNAIKKLKEKRNISASQEEMLRETQYGEKVTTPAGVNQRLYTNPWAQEMRKAYKEEGLDNEELINALIAQDALESRWGQSKQVEGHYNYGNITAGKNWKRKTYSAINKDAEGKDKEYVYRHYDSVNDYVRDKIAFSKNNYGITENDSFEEVVRKFQGGNDANREYAEALNYADAMGAVYYGTKVDLTAPKENVLNEAKLLEWQRKAPILNPTQFRGGFKDGKWEGSDNFDLLESGDFISFKDDKVIPKMLGYQGAYNSKGEYESITVNAETLEPVKITDEGMFDLEGNELKTSQVRVVGKNTPEYDEILRRGLSKRESVSLEKGDNQKWATGSNGEKLNITEQQAKSFFNYAIDASKRSTKLTAKEALLRSNKNKSTSPNGFQVGNGDFIQSMAVNENEPFDLSKMHVGESDNKNYSPLDLNYIQEDDWVVDMSTLNGGNVIKAEPLDDLRGEYKTDENGNRYLDRGYEGEPNLDIRSDMTKSIQSGFKKATSKLSDWFTFQKKAKVQESQSIDMNRVASIEKDIEDAAVKKIEVVQGAKPSLPALKPIEVKEKKEEKKILDKKQPTSTVITNITTFNSVDSLMRDDIGNIGTA